MATAVILPKFDMTTEDATIARWLKQEGEAVREGEPLVEVITDKVNMEVEAPTSGILAGIRAQPGQNVPVTRVIAYIVQPGEALPDDVEAAAPIVGDTENALSEGSARGAGQVAEPMYPGRGPSGVAAAPAVRRLAQELGVDLTAIMGSGPGGRITEVDVRAAAERSAGGRAAPGASPPKEIPLTGRRATIARRMAASARAIPHIYLTRAVEMSAAAASRGEASYTAVIVHAVSRVLPAHALLRAALAGDVIRIREAIHIGVAVDTADGVVVPVVRDADRKSLAALQREIEDLARRARDNRLTREHLDGGTFTVSNLGMFGLDWFTPLIFPPQAALLAAGAVRSAPWVAGEAVVIRPVCELTLALDHRIADGAAGARFLDDLARALQNPNGR